MAPRARIWWDPTITAYKLQCGFKPQLVDFLKKTVPSSDRTFDPQTKIWTFTEPYFVGTVDLMNLLYGQGQVAVLTRAQVEAASAQQARSASVQRLNTSELALAEFMKIIPYEAAKKAYREASLMFHPDRPNGDVSKMTRLNSLWAQIEKEVYGR